MKKEKTTLIIVFGILLQVSCNYILASNIEAMNSEGNTYYVSPNGSDLAEGSFEKPWGTLQYAFEQLKAGDTLFVRGGTYTDISNSKYGLKYEGEQSGTELKHICVFAYADEKPILNFESVTGAGMRYGLYLKNVNYWHIKGLHFTKLDQPTTGNISFAFYAEDSNNNIFEQLQSYENKAVGLRITGESEGNMLINCDVYNNYDPYSTSPGGNGDGIQVSSITYREGNPRINTLKGCRSWYNSDDGFDFWKNEGTVIVEDCWAFNNGRDKGDGNGFKLGKTLEPREEGVTQRILRRCIVANNRKWGINNNAADVYADFFNVICIDNGSRGFYLDMDVEMVATIKNCISYKNKYDDRFGTKTVAKNNSWNLNSITVSDDDFLSIDHLLLESEREEDGSLPETDYLKLKNTSDLIDAGVDVGLTYNGEAPDLGPFEYEANVSVANLNLFDDDIQIYPNPSNTGVVNIRLATSNSNNKINIGVFDLSGKLIAKNVMNAPLLSKTMDLSDKYPGIYIMKLEGDVDSQSCIVILNH